MEPNDQDWPSNLWSKNGYLETTREKAWWIFIGEACCEFFYSSSAASDAPCFSPPNSLFPAVLTPLTKQNAFLLLDWIGKLKGHCIAEKFLTCIEESSWLKVNFNGFLHTSSWGDILQNGSVHCWYSIDWSGFLLVMESTAMRRR